MRPPEIHSPLRPIELPAATSEPATIQIALQPAARAASAAPTKLALRHSSGLLARVETSRPHSNHPVAAVRPSEMLALGSYPAARATKATRGGKPRKRGGSLQKLLVATIVMATIGTLASGTLATFTAQTSNANGTFATGSLVLGNQPTGKVQLSSTVINGASLASIPIFRLASPIAAGATVTVSDGTPAGWQTVTVASAVLPGATAIPTSGGPTAARTYAQGNSTVNFPLSSASVKTTVAIASGAAITTLTVGAIQNLVPIGTVLTLTNGLTSQTLTTNASANIGATSFSTVSLNASITYPIGSTVLWSGAGLATATTASVTGTVTAIPVNSTTAAIPANAVILLNNPAVSAPNLQTLTVTNAVVPLGATSIPVVSTALNNTYPAGSVVSYNYSSGSLCYSTATSSGTFNNANANAGCNSLSFTGYGRPQSNSENAYAADLTITNQGSIAATKLSVYMANCVTTNNLAETYNGTGDLCTKLEMFVQEWQDAQHTVALTCLYGSGSASTCTNPPPDPSPTLSAFNTSAAPLTPTGSLSPKGSAGDTRYFTIGLRLPTLADNTYQGRLATFDLVWTLTQ